MKKFLFIALIAALFGISSKVNAQCSGANVLITNVSVNQTVTHYVYQFNWTYIQGNASIQVRFRCGGVFTYDALCIPKLTDSTAGQHFVKDSFLISAVPVCNAPALKEVVIGVWSSSNCNGTFCPQSQNITVPVVFSSFEAKRNKSAVTVTWSTSSELNNSGFAIERNVNGNWEQVGWVASKSLNGNSDVNLQYSYTDQNNAKGISQYRIRQVDIDAKSKYTDVRSVRGEGQLGKTIVYPNPSNNGKVNVVFEDAAGTRDISISDMNGRVVRQMKGITNNNITVDNLNPGMYMLRIVAVETGEQAVEKIVVNKH